MFTGIVKGTYPVSKVIRKPGMLSYSVHLDAELCGGLQIGASVSVDGTCQSVVRLDENHVEFDAIQETLDKTTLKSLSVGSLVHIERAAKFGDEIGGHLLSGHVMGCGEVTRIERPENNFIMTLKVPVEWMKYIFHKGFIAMDGASLTVTEVKPKQGLFSVHLIPETLQVTHFAQKKVGDWVNIEIDAQTVAVVETVERVLESQRKTNA